MRNRFSAEFAEATFAPEFSIYKGETCHGVSVAVTDRAAFDPIRTGVAIAIALSTAYPMTWRLEKMEGLLGDARTLDAIRVLASPGDAWRELDAGPKTLAPVRTTVGNVISHLLGRRPRLLTYLGV